MNDYSITDDGSHNIKVNDDITIQNVNVAEGYTLVPKPTIPSWLMESIREIELHNIDPTYYFMESCISGNRDEEWSEHKFLYICENIESILLGLKVGFVVRNLPDTNSIISNRIIRWLDGLIEQIIVPDKIIREFLSFLFYGEHEYYHTLDAQDVENAWSNVYTYMSYIIHKVEGGNKHEN